jgi:hypothetical protein
LLKAVQALEVMMTLLAQQIATILPQNIPPMPFLKQSQHADFAEFGISDQQHAALSGDQAADFLFVF